MSIAPILPGTCLSTKISHESQVLREAKFQGGWFLLRTILQGEIKATSRKLFKMRYPVILINRHKTSNKELTNPTASSESKRWWRSAVLIRAKVSLISPQEGNLRRCPQCMEEIHQANIKQEWKFRHNLVKTTNIITLQPKQKGKSGHRTQSDSQRTQSIPLSDRISTIQPMAPSMMGCFPISHWFLKMKTKWGLTQTSTKWGQEPFTPWIGIRKEDKLRPSRRVCCRLGMQMHWKTSTISSS